MKLLTIILKVLLLASVATVITVAFMFSADAIVLIRAIKVFGICYIVFFGSLALWICLERREHDGDM